LELQESATPLLNVMCLTPMELTKLNCVSM
jgi:hypothetical protein